MIYGWYGEDDVLVLDESTEPYRVVAIDRQGRETRHLAGTSHPISRSVVRALQGAGMIAARFSSASHQDLSYRRGSMPSWRARTSR
ncbi:hypothetical protein C1J01_19585 [Nonomuraea aridisoli]|uniref:Uncharacterized protein n=1 Tax=Nonomuraea aridisoli TaxID=2070368 RepID=A0A2W2E3R5_9ACTN|nr:hypothetical protein C1J01_19585 [Nonomuraea aridisoli]